MSNSYFIIVMCSLLGYIIPLYIIYYIIVWNSNNNNVLAISHAPADEVMLPLRGVSPSSDVNELGSLRTATAVV